MKIALVGWGVETKSAFHYYGSAHEYYIVSEEPRVDFPHADNVTIQALQNHRKPGLTGTVQDLKYLEGLDTYDLIVYTPTARKNLEKVYAKDNIFWSKATSCMELFFKTCPSSRMIGVTGTKGKGTTTTLIATLLQNMGNTVHVGGNIGIPVLDLLPDIKQDDWIVLEMSSFQLYEFPYSPHIAVHLMMVPEHIMEWHKTMDDYVTSKRNIFSHQTTDDIAIYHATNPYAQSNARASAGQHIPYLAPPGAYIDNDHMRIGSTDLIRISDIALPGRHNLENICAALTAVWQIDQNIDAMRAALREFRGLEHRLQKIGEHDGVSYYDDSFGTTPDTAIVAMDAFSQPKVMIVGGHDKGSEYSQMITRLQGEDIRAIICIGPTGDKIATELQKIGFDSDRLLSKAQPDDWTMMEIVERARSYAHSGDVVLLSTGSASFGMFNDYKDRGNQFIKSVSVL